MRCPKCGGQDVAKILYGLPAFDTKLEEDFRCGRIILGGCEEGVNNHHWHCNTCKNEF